MFVTCIKLRLIVEQKLENSSFHLSISSTPEMYTENNFTHKENRFQNSHCMLLIYLFNMGTYVFNKTSFYVYFYSSFLLQLVMYVI